MGLRTAIESYHCNCQSFLPNGLVLYVPYVFTYICGRVLAYVCKAPRWALITCSESSAAISWRKVPAPSRTE